jgi:hypothetical protein
MTSALITSEGKQNKGQTAAGSCDKGNHQLQDSSLHVGHTSKHSLNGLVRCMLFISWSKGGTTFENVQSSGRLWRSAAECGG